MILTLIASVALAFFAIAAPLTGPRHFDFRITNLFHGNAPHELIVFNPTITSPTLGTVWEMGKRYYATWNTTNIPPEKQNATGLVLLGHAGNGSENLDIQHPLATSFPLADGSVALLMPLNVEPRNDYFIVLFGDSGNTSPEFSLVPPS